MMGKCLFNRTPKLLNSKEDVDIQKQIKNKKASSLKDTIIVMKK